MCKFSNRKLISILLISLFFAIPLIADDFSPLDKFNSNIASKSNDSASLSKLSESTDERAVAIINKIKNAIESAKVEYVDGNIKIISKEVYGNSFLTELSLNVYDVSRNISIAGNVDIVNLKINVLVNDSLCDVLGLAGVVVLPGSIGAKEVNLLLSTSYDASSLSNAFSFLVSNQKNQKKYDTEDEVEDLRLRINIVYIDKDLIQQDIIALNPTTLTTGSTTNFRAKGGLGVYFWRLLPAEGSDSRISATEGSDTAYTASSSTSRSFDVLALSDGVEEVELNVVVAKARLEKDGSGSKGESCFIRKKFRD